MPKPPRWKPNVTVAAVVERNGRYLMVEEQTRDGLRLNTPAGHLDPQESLEQAVVREVLEETACRFTPQALLGVYLSRFLRCDETGTEDVIYLPFAFTGEIGEPDPALRLDKGIVRTLWMTPDELRASAPRHRSPLVLQCLEDHLAGRRFPLQLLKVHPSLYEPFSLG